MYFFLDLHVFLIRIILAVAILPARFTWNVISAFM